MRDRLIVFVEVRVSFFFPLVLITTDVTLFTKRDCDAGVMQEERAHRGARREIRCNYFQLLINVEPKAH